MDKFNQVLEFLGLCQADGYELAAMVRQMSRERIQSCEVRPNPNGKLKWLIVTLDKGSIYRFSSEK